MCPIALHPMLPVSGFKLKVKMYSRVEYNYYSLVVNTKRLLCRL